MKLKASPLILWIMFFNCHNNELANNNIKIQTDKNTYQVNDTIQLTLTITPKQEPTTIKLYKNLRNVNIYFVSNEEQLGFHQELKKRFIEGPSLNEEESEYLDEYHITKEKPYKHTFTGIISESGDKIVVEIPDLNAKDSLDKKYLLQDPTVTIKGGCQNIYSFEEEPFPPVQINIAVD